MFNNSIYLYIIRYNTLQKMFHFLATFCTDCLVNSINMLTHISNLVYICVSKHILSIYNPTEKYFNISLQNFAIFLPLVKVKSNNVY